MNLFLQAKAGPGPILGLFLATEQEEFFLKRPRFWNHFGSFYGPGTLQVTTFYHLLDYLAAQAGPEKKHDVDERNSPGYIVSYTIVTRIERLKDSPNSHVNSPANKSY